MTTKSSEAPKATAKSRKPAAKKQAAAPSKEEITRLAEKYWAERGWPEGRPLWPSCSPPSPYRRPWGAWLEGHSVAIP